MTDESSQLYENPLEFLYEDANETDVGRQGSQEKDQPSEGRNEVHEEEVRRTNQNPVI